MPVQAAICLASLVGSADNRLRVSNTSMTFQRTLALVIVLLICAPHRNTAAAQAGDFGFRFESGTCWTERLDTFGGVFTQDLGGSPPRTVTAQMSLTDA